MLDEQEQDAIVDEAMRGRPLREVAKSRGLTIARVRSILDEVAAYTFGAEQLRRDLLLEVRRLRAIEQRYFERDDVAASAIYLKASERLATLIGMNQPIGMSVQLIHAKQIEQQETSTENLRRIFEEMRLEGQAKRSNGDGGEPQRDPRSR